MQIPAYVALGSNLGNREVNVREAARRMAELAVDSVRLSSLYLTTPDAMDDAPDFVNAVATFGTKLGARALLEALQTMEIDMGRPADHDRLQSRTIDLDLIAFGDFRINEPGLIVPHPRAHLRDFVLLPLAELVPDLRLPGQSGTVRELVNGFSGHTRIISISAGNHHE